MIYKILLFGGTTEGRLLAEGIRKAGCGPACVFTATEYGSSLIRQDEGLDVHYGRTGAEEMRTILKENPGSLVLDATHPFAVEVSENLKNACRMEGHRYIRILREEGDSEGAGSLYTVSSVAEAAELLEKKSGNILVTTGSKELGYFTTIPGYRDRIFARVLSLPEVVRKCADYGIEGAHLICMQGPFSTEMNIALIHQTKARWLVTKDSGSAGGLQEKLKAARICGTHVVLIRKPGQDPQGISVTECLKLLKNDSGFSGGKAEKKERETAWNHSPHKKVIAIIGAGTSADPGEEGDMTSEAVHFCRGADLMIGSARLRTLAEKFDREYVCTYLPDKMIEILKQDTEHHRIAILYSGDPGFFSSAEELAGRIRKAFPESEYPGIHLYTIPGISSIAAFSARIQKSWQDARILSMHGKQPNILYEIRKNRKVFCILGTESDVRKAAAKLTDSGMKEVRITAGERIGYPDEKITEGTAEKFLDFRHDPLAVALFENPSPDCSAHPSLPDAEFERGKVPMTKEEVRAVLVAKIRPEEDDVIYDIGAGTGSVTVELARCLKGGHVYAVEKNPEGLDLIRENARKFGLDQVIPIEGEAPDILEELPAPDRAFIGGSTGKMREIIEMLRRKNPSVRIVISAVTLETISETEQVMDHYRSLFPDIDTEVCMIQVSKARKLGRYQMMTGQNPVYIFVLDFAV